MRFDAFYLALLEMFYCHSIENKSYSVRTCSKLDSMRYRQFIPRNDMKRNLVFLIQMPGKISEEVLKEQEERAEYVKNIGIEYRFGCYEVRNSSIAGCKRFFQEKRPDSCQLLGEYMEALQQNFQSALTIFKKNCDENSYPKSCFKYGMYMLAGKTEEKTLNKMIRPMTIACDANIPQGCRYLSLVYWNGEKDRKPDSQKAEQYMRKACELEDGEACWLLSTWYMGNKEKFKVTAAGEAKVSSNMYNYMFRNKNSFCEST